MKRVYVVVGEMSGDSHGGALLRGLVGRLEGVEIFGVGGPQVVAASGGRAMDWVEDAAVMGVVEVLKRYGWFKERFGAMLEEVKGLRPDVLLLVDYPGFNLRFAEAVKRELPETKIVYYISPQVWAWNKGRIPKMVRLLDEMLCLFPFERPIFEGAGLKTTFVGHPLVDELAQERVVVERDLGLVGLFPGSREREVEKLFPMMLGTVKRLREWRGELRFEVPAATPKLGGVIREMVEAAGLMDVVRVTDGGSHGLMQRAGCGVVASGTATLEAAVFGLPYCLVYRMAAVTYLFARVLVKIPFIGLVNILAGEKVVEEFIQDEAEPMRVGDWVRGILEDDVSREALMLRLGEVSARLGEPGACDRAAERVARWLE